MIVEMREFALRAIIKAHRTNADIALNDANPLLITDDVFVQKYSGE